MDRRTILSLSTIAVLGLALLPGSTIAAQSDMNDVKAANQAFYSALSARDINAMQKVWSQRANIRHIGPRNKAIDTGWNDIKKGIETTFDAFPQLSVTEEQVDIQINGKMAFVSGIEKAQRKNKAGEPSNGTNFGTSIFEKQGKRWLMVYHHASPVTQ